MPQLLVVIASTRPGRVGLPVADWFVEKARTVGGFEVKVCDLKEVGLPLMDEPNHPVMGNYTKDHTRAWSAMVDAADAFVFVMPEYNYAMTAPLKNALDYLAREWHYKPAGLVSYGGISGGLRAAQMVKQVLTTLKMMPIPEAVAIPIVREHIVEGRFQPTELMEQNAVTMVNELQRWESALKTLRKK
jgi:NAD(P)H-dependent FMN reductase